MEKLQQENTQYKQANEELKKQKVQVKEIKAAPISVEQPKQTKVEPAMTTPKQNVAK
jgi:hypothetical protein